VGSLAHIAIIVLVGFYVFWQLNKLACGRKLNVPKLLLMAATLATHYAVFYIVALPALATMMDTAYHDVQYHGWMAHFQRRHFGVANAARRWFIASLIYGLATGLCVLLPAPAAVYANHLFLGVILFHYLIEAKIWQFGKDPRLADLMFGKGRHAGRSNVDSPRGLAPG
jgi:hypothetical protein